MREKYGVQQDPDRTKEAAQKCSKCGASLENHSGVWKCPTHGTSV